MFVSLRVVNLCSVGIVDRCIVGTVNRRVHEDGIKFVFGLFCWSKIRKN